MYLSWCLLTSKRRMGISYLLSADGVRLILTQDSIKVFYSCPLFEVYLVIFLEEAPLFSDLVLFSFTQHFLRLSMTFIFTSSNSIIPTVKSYSAEVLSEFRGSNKSTELIRWFLFPVFGSQLKSTVCGWDAVNSASTVFFLWFQARRRVVAPFPWHQRPATLRPLANGVAPAGHGHRAPDGVCALAGRSSRGSPEEEMLLRSVPRPVGRFRSPRQQARRPPLDELWPRVVIAHKDPTAVCGAGATAWSRTLRRGRKLFSHRESCRMRRSRWDTTGSPLLSDGVLYLICCLMWFIRPEMLKPGHEQRTRSPIAETSAPVLCFNSTNCTSGDCRTLNPLTGWFCARVISQSCYSDSSVISHMGTDRWRSTAPDCALNCSSSLHVVFPLSPSSHTC